LKGTFSLINLQKIIRIHFPPGIFKQDFFEIMKKSSPLERIGGDCPRLHDDICVLQGFILIIADKCSGKYL
jgi:hypothetical protein